MGKQNRSMASVRSIKKHWARWLVVEGKFDLAELEEGDYCFACGFEGELQRAHIVPRCKGGPDSKENLHILCYDCHQHSELLETREEYMAWFRRRNPIDRFASQHLRDGGSLVELILGGGSSPSS